MNYDYIITGSGCAGLSLLYRILKDPVLSRKSILVIDKSPKNTNDRTWCFWEKEQGLFEEVVFHQWKKLEFLSDDFSETSGLGDYSYKMIRSIDFYRLVLSFAEKFKNVTFKYEDVLKISSEKNYPFVETDKGTYTAEFVFNSTGLFNPDINTENSLLQHFEGWVIKTEQPVFDQEVGTLMDFRLSQKNGTTFMYVLPTSSNQALIEYTLFSEKLLEKSEYKLELENYIKDYLKIDSYELLEKEFGVIPMSLASFSRHPKADKRIVNLGTAGGFTKASSGYTFQFIQKNTAEIVENLRKGRAPHPKVSFHEKLYQLYDRTLLDVMISGKLDGKFIFATMFKKLPFESILAFLGNESSFVLDLKIMNTMPALTFMKAGIRSLK